MGFSYVRDAGNTTTAATSVAVTIVAPAIGNFLTCSVGSITATVTTISGACATWTKADAGTQGVATHSELWYGTVTSADTTVTVNLSGTDAASADVIEFAGVTPASPLHKNNHASGTVANPTSGSVTPTVGVTLLVACSAYVPTTSTVSSQTAGWTATTTETAGTAIKLVTSYNILTNAAATSDTWTLNVVATSYASSIAAFLPTDPSITKLYLAVGGPVTAGVIPTATVSATTATQGNGASANALVPTRGVAQTSATIATTATKSAQTSRIAWPFVSPPLVAQTLPVQSISFVWAWNQSNLNSNLSDCQVLAVYRPSTNSVVGRLLDQATGLTTSNAGLEIITTISRTSTAVTCQDGDVLVYEYWTMCTQSKATSYSHTVYWGGTVEADGTTSDAGTNLSFAVAPVFKYGAIPEVHTPNLTRVGRRQAVNRTASY